MPNNTEEYGKPPVKIDRPSKDSSFDDFFGTDNPKGNNLDQNKETPYKTSRQKKNLQVMTSLAPIVLKGTA